MSGIDIYHERQSLQLCALHALNNLFQAPTFTKADLDSLCLELAPDSFSWWNPHRSPLGLGNYDVNILMAALQRRGFDTVWFDKRRDIRNSLVPEHAFGFILNVPGQWSVTKLLPKNYRPKHWKALKRFGLNYYNLDSNLPAPELVGEAREFLEFLSGQLNMGDGRELIIVVDPKVTTDQNLWLKNDETGST